MITARGSLLLIGVTHRIELEPARAGDDRWTHLLTVSSPSGEGQALLTPDEVRELIAYLGGNVE